MVLRTLASSVHRVKQRLMTADEPEEEVGEDVAREDGAEDPADGGPSSAAVRSAALSEMLLEFNEGGVDVDIGGAGGTGRSFPEGMSS